MENKSNIGDCALCEKKRVKLRQSHIIPKAIYKRTKTFKNSRFRSHYEPRNIFQDGEKKYMLCGECEKFFSKYETKFANMFLDKYLQSRHSKLPMITEDVEFYILTVSWRIIYDDLYAYDSYTEDGERMYLEEYEHKLRNFLYQRFIKETTGELTSDMMHYNPNFDGKCFGETIAEIEKYQRGKLPEDMSEVKNYIYSLSELGFSDAVVRLFDSMIFGYTFYNSMRTKYYIISGYKGLIITTVYCRKRNLLITKTRKLFTKAYCSESVIKKDVVDEIKQLINEMRKSYPEVQEKLNYNGLRDKIAKRYENNN